MTILIGQPLLAFTLHPVGHLAEWRKARPSVSGAKPEETDGNVLIFYLFDIILFVIFVPTN
jgi:hypothetical protein